MNKKKAQFPKINYEYWFQKNNWENRSSIQTMLTNLKNKQLVDNKITVNNIKDEISSEIKQYLESGSDDSILNVFTYIQVWGGASTRIYTPIIIQNFESYKYNYKYAVSKILNKEISESYRFLKNEGKIKGIGPSFIPKHICFWSGRGNRIDGVPILDNVISKILYNDSVNKIDYDSFILEINDFSKSINMKPAEVEIALFSFSQNYWETAKTRSNNFRKNIEDKKDENIAKNIIND